ncbi:MAG: hypothetical protein AB1503_02100 [Bacillota bacterium]|nr:hypothetical protein [Bacillota bacterium]
MPGEKSEEDLLRELEELRRELYRVTGGTPGLEEEDRELAERISTRLDRLVVEVVRRRKTGGQP